jgi:hypothetical protein
MKSKSSPEADPGLKTPWVNSRGRRLIYDRRKDNCRQPEWLEDEDTKLLQLARQFPGRWVLIAERLYEAYLTLHPRSAEACKQRAIRLKRNLGLDIELTQFGGKKYAAGVASLSDIEKLAMCKAWR